MTDNHAKFGMKYKTKPRYIDPAMVRMYQAAKELKGIDGRTNVARFLLLAPAVLYQWEQRGPSSDGLIAAQEKIGCFVGWVKTGEGPMSNEALSNISPKQKTAPLLSFDDLRDYRRSVVEVGGKMVAITSKNLSDGTFVVTAVDQLNAVVMPVGSNIVIDPDATIDSGDWCMFKRGDKVYIRQLLEAGGRRYLQTADPTFGREEMPADAEILGVAKEVISML